MEKKSIKGVHFGNLIVDDKNLSGIHNEQTQFKIPLNNISNCLAVNESELMIELNTNNLKDE